MSQKHIFAIVLISSLVGADDTEENVRLQRSVVTAGGIEQELEVAPASVSIVDPQEIQKRPVRDLAEALSNVPGVSIDNGVGKTGGYSISIRGMPSDYTLILMDGRRVNADSSLFPNGFSQSITSFMPPLGAIKRIEVIRGPASTLYGSDAIGGVVNVITKDSFEKWSASVGVDYTLQEKKYFGDTKSFNLYTAGPLNQAKNWGLTLRGRIYDRDSVKSEDLKQVSLASGRQPRGLADGALRNTIVGLAPFTSYNLGSRLSWHSLDSVAGEAKQRMYLDVDYSRQTYDNSLGLLGTFNKFINPQYAKAEAGYAERMVFSRSNVVLAHKGSYVDSDGLFSTFKTDSAITYNLTTNHDRFITNEVFKGGTKVRNGVAAGDSRELENEDIILDHKINTYLNLSESFGANISLGARYWYNRFNDKLFQVTGGKAKQIQHIGALFGEGEFIGWDRVFLTLGARANFNSIFGSNISPRAYVAYKIVPDYLTLKGGVSTGYKSPALSQLVDGVANLTRQGTVPIYGDPNLKPESSTNYELSAISENDVFSFALTGFYSLFVNKITSTQRTSNGSQIGRHTCNAEMGCTMYVNVGQAVSYGLETSLDIKPVSIGIGNLGLSTAYTFTQSKNRSSSGANTGERFVNVPRHSFNGSLNYSNSYFGAYIRQEIKTHIYRGNPNVALTPAAALGEFYKPIYLTHLGINLNEMKGIRVNFAIYNLFDVDFLDFTAYQASNNGKVTTQYANAYNYIREGRRYYLSLTYEF
ncbi:TonB-dependent receptor [Helicobacter sp. 10-6591]|uniref:TonB-dependent receptor domain-containing protein n=1 Tax=Helicobacter sp. 10-6591 TaxID=2004998 RepID=UPI000DCE0F58|nr:TonB-dependent receptor [Helicobacter sp. 10-6591]RAX55998.1 hypothetical protein CCY97_01455 [Helicobacter sp. 10-6591]